MLRMCEMVSWGTDIIAWSTTCSKEPLSLISADKLKEDLCQKNGVYTTVVRMYNILCQAKCMNYVVATEHHRSVHRLNKIMTPNVQLYNFLWRNRWESSLQGLHAHTWSSTQFPLYIGIYSFIFIEKLIYITTRLI